MTQSEHKLICDAMFEFVLGTSEKWFKDMTKAPSLEVIPEPGAPQVDPKESICNINVTAPGVKIGFNIYYPHALATKFCCQALKKTEDQLTAQNVTSFIGEFANMVMGSIKGKIASVVHIPTEVQRIVSLPETCYVADYDKGVGAGATGQQFWTFKAAAGRVVVESFIFLEDDVHMNQADVVAEEPEADDGDIEFL